MQEGDPGAAVTVDSSTISNNATGVQSFSSVRLFNDAISFNATAVSGNTGSFGSNRLSGNVSDGTSLAPLNEK